MMKSESTDKRIQKFQTKQTVLQQDSIHITDKDDNLGGMAHGDHVHKGSEMEIRKQIAEENYDKIKSIEKNLNSEQNID